MQKGTATAFGLYAMIQIAKPPTDRTHVLINNIYTGAYHIYSTAGMIQCYIGYKGEEK